MDLDLKSGNIADDLSQSQVNEDDLDQENNHAGVEESGGASLVDVVLRLEHGDIADEGERIEVL